VNKSDRVQILTAVLCESFCLVLHRRQSIDFVQQMSFICSRFCETAEEREVLVHFLDFTLICYPVFDLSKDMKTLSTEMGYFSIDQVTSMCQE
jgi:hypothetical protein